jgi:FKBP-type peptidyl-prolyl cis-trans isomerase FklB
MKKSLVVICFSMTGLMAAAQVKPKPKPVVKPAAKSVAATPLLKTRLDSLSYSFGQSVAGQLKNVEVKELNYALFRKGVEDGMKGNVSELTPEQMNACLNEHFMGVKMEEVNAEKAKAHKFLEENKKRPGIQVLPSGLQYEIITAGTGPIPQANDTIVANYAGSLIDGREFDNSYKRGQPIKAPANGLIKGWTEALVHMPAGSKWKLYIPSDLAYGDYGAGQEIPGGAALIFEMELLEVIPAKTTENKN